MVYNSSWTELIVPLSTVIGAIVGVVTLLRSIKKGKPKLKVTEKTLMWRCPDGTITETFGLSVKNLSTYPIYIEECGYIIEKRFLGIFGFRININKKRMVGMDELYTRQYPTKLDSRQEETFLLPIFSTEKNYRFHGYATTQCGLTVIDKRKKRKYTFAILSLLFLLFFLFLEFYVD